MKKKLPYLLLIAGCLVFDQVTKLLVDAKVRYLESVTVIPGFFNLTHIKNRGAIFGFFDHGGGGQTKFLIITVGALVALAFVTYYFIVTTASDRLTLTGLSLIMAGALGNLADRFLKGSVTDFLDFYIKNWHWPFFNVADSCITIGACLLVLTLVIRRK
jgi:signal peptidase II